MSAYNHLHARTISAETAALNEDRLISRQSTRLTEPQLEFLNSDACQHVNPYVQNFWPELTGWLAAASEPAGALPKAYSYRCALEPHLFQQVHMLAKTWTIKETPDAGRVRLLLEDVRLTNVRGSHVGKAPNAAVDHMNIWVSTAWFNRVAPAIDEPLALDGVLYEYASSKQVRNIGILPVLVMPLSRKPGGFWKNCAARPDTVCPERAA